MRNVSPELRSAWQSLAEAEGDRPGYPYDHGYLTGWHDVRRKIRRRLARGTFRTPESVEEWRLGYKHGRADGKGRRTDWWPDHALGDVITRDDVGDGKEAQ